MGIEAASSAVEGLAAIAKVAAGQSRIPATGAVEIPPDQPNLGFPAQLLSRARRLVSTKHLLFSNMHTDTLSECRRSF